MSKLPVDGKTTAAALAGAVAFAALALAGTAQAGPAPNPGASFEKCYGIVKAAQNDCQTASNSCAGTSAKDHQADAWIYLPKGSCAKIAGAALKPGA